MIRSGGEGVLDCVFPPSPNQGATTCHHAFDATSPRSRILDARTCMPPTRNGVTRQYFQQGHLELALGPWVDLLALLGEPEHEPELERTRAPGFNL